MNDIMNNNVREMGFLFDLDGVLIDSEKEYTKIWDKINIRFPTGISDLSLRIKGMTLVEILDTYFPLYKKEEIEKMLYDLEGKMKYEWLPGAQELLTALQENNIPAVLVTSSNEKKMQHLSYELPGAEQYFLDIVTGDMVTNSKPHPEGYILGAGIIGCPPEKCVVFEDSLQGVKAGRAAGAYVVGIAGTLPKNMIAPFCDTVIDSLEEINYKSVINILNRR